MKSFLKSLVVLALIVAGTTTASFAQIDYHDYHHDSLEWPEDKPILLDFRAEWCRPCIMMERTTLKDTTVIHYVTDHFFVVRCDAASEDAQGLMKKYDVEDYPTFVVLDAKNEDVLIRIVGYETVQELIDNLTASIKGTRFDQ